MWIWVLLFCGLCWWGWFRPRRYRNRSYRMDPYEIARERLARGEITAQEYDEIMKKLSNS